MAKSIDELAQEVLNGKWGSGEARKTNLEKAGYDYNAVQKRVNEIIKQSKPYQNLKESNYIGGDVVRIGQATSNEKGELAGGSAGDKNGKEVALANWSYASGDKYNSWKHVFRAKDTAARLKIAQAAIDACNNNHIGYDTGSPDRKSCFKEAQKVHFDLSKVAVNCETTCSELANVCIAAADLSSYLPVSKAAYVESLTTQLSKSSEFNDYTSYATKSVNLLPGDIIISGSHTAIVVKVPAKKTIDQLAQEVLDGKWGSGDARKKNLESAGYDYVAIQKKVNEIVTAKSQTQSQGYTGTLPTLKLIKSNAEVKADAVKWAKWIAGDNRFHYGYTNAKKTINAHHNGCYFCGTNTTKGGRSKKGIVDYKRTYCCNPFVGAAWAHGGCVPAALKLCQAGSSWNFSKGTGYDKSSLFNNLGHPAKSKLKSGDVLCSDSHVALYIGNGKIAEALSGDDNVRNSKKWNNSIHIATLTDARYKKFKRVHRFNSSVNAILYIRHGEVSKRVADWQSFLDWWYDGKVGSADGIYGDNTYNWTVKFQNEQIGQGQGDGIIGPLTLEAAKKCVDSVKPISTPTSALTSAPVVSTTSWVDNANAWARKIAADNTYHYVKWSDNSKTHECPICHKHAKGKYHGWNCIGFAYAVWHHGGKLKNKCNCHVISNAIAEQMYNAKSINDALKIAQQHTGLKNITVIRNKRGISKEKWKAGDICLKFNGKKYIHTFYYMGKGKIADSTGSSGKVANDKQIAVRSYDKYSCKIIIRYKGK